LGVAVGKCFSKTRHPGRRNTITFMKYLLISFIVILFCQCQSEPAATGSGSLYVRYEQPEKRIKAEATFTETDAQGVEKSKVFQGGLSFLGGGMKTKMLPGNKLRYEYEQFGKLPQELPFRFKEQDGSEKIFSLKINVLDNFTFQDSVIVKSKNSKLSWQGSPLSASEKLVLLFTDAANQTHNLEYNGPTTSPAVVITPEKLLSFSPGVARLYLVRIDAQELKQQGYQLFYQTELYTQTKAVTIRK
jgi:hypothetical protein